MEELKPIVDFLFDSFTALFSALVDGSFSWVGWCVVGLPVVRQIVKIFNKIFK